MVLFFLKWATNFPCLPHYLNIKNLWQGCPALTSICLLLAGQGGCCFDFEAQP